MSKPGKMPFTERALAQLTLVRFREFIREPEALFWVFIFPILLAAGLGIAFRNRPPEVLNIAALTPELARSLAGEKLLHVQQLPPAGAEEALRSEEHTSELQSLRHLVCRLLLEKKK